MSNLLNRFKISFKLTFLVAFSVVGFALLAGVSLNTLYTSMMEDRAAKTRSLSEVGRDVVKHYYELAQSGQMDQASAQKAAREALRGVRFDQGDYLFIYDYDGNCLLQPTRPEREGQNFSKAQDPSGRFFIADLIKAGQKDGAPVYYTYTRPGSDVAAAKVGTTLAFEPWRWAIGSAIYVDDVKAEFHRTAWQLVVIVTPIVLTLTLVGFVVARNIARPVRALGETAQDLAHENYDVEIPGEGRGDEIGGLSRALRVLRDSAREAAGLRAEQERLKKQAEIDRVKSLYDLADTFDSEVRGVVEAVSTAAAHLRSTAEDMTRISDEEISRTDEVSKSLSSAASNVETVAAATEELSASIVEIGSQVTRSADISKNAVEQASRTDKIVSFLAESAHEIDQVVGLIHNIAEQTNLLALNATIEAARAGEAGRGFAVVAGEVKTLANQTAKATEDITHRIAAIQKSTGEAVAAIQDITRTIGEISHVSSTIASAVEQQSAATKEISHNIEQTSSSTGAVSENMVVMRDISVKAGSGAKDVLGAATDLSERSEQMKTHISAFIARLKRG